MGAIATADDHMVERAPLRMTYEEYLAFEHEGGLAEWVDGEVIFHMPPLDEHQSVVEFLHGLLGLFVSLFNLGKVRLAPFSVRCRPDGPAREPDLFFLAAEHMDRLSRREVAGPPDLAVEVISDDSVGRDRGDKFYEYQEGGVREYWIIDPRPGKERMDCYQLLADGKYQAILPDAAGRYQSSVLPGFYLRPAWLWGGARPDPLAALAEIRGLAPETARALRAALMGEPSSHDHL